MKKQGSITRKLILSVAALVIGFMVLLILLNEILLEDYYVFKLKSSFVNEAYNIEEIYDKEDKIFKEYLVEQGNIKGYKYTIVDEKGQIYISSVPELKSGDGAKMPKHQFDYMKNKISDLNTEYIYTEVSHPERAEDQVMLVMKLEINKYIVITEQLQEIRLNAAIANRFLILTGSSMLVIILGITYFLSNRLVKPVIELSDIAKEIANMNFDALYKGNLQDEIGVLGQNINIISMKLNQAIKELEDKNNKLKDDIKLQRYFLASVSHEFKSPVGIIQGYAESVKLNFYKNEEEKNEFVDYIIEESKRLNNLVEDMMMLAELDKRKFDLSKKETNMSSLVLDVYNKYQKNFGEINVIPNVHIQNDIIAEVDGFRMIQVLENLITNARRYMDKGGQLSLTLKEEKNQIVLSVKNECKDFNKEELSDIFIIFYRTEQSRNRTTGGHGLGLPIVKAIIEAHGANIDANYTNGCLEIIVEIKN